MKMGQGCSQNGRNQNLFQDFTGKPTGKRPLGRRLRRKDNRIDLEGVNVYTRNWIDSSQDRDYQAVYETVVLNLRIPDFMELAVTR